MPSQNTISAYPCTHVQSEHHLLNLCSISHHISFSCLVSSSPLVPMHIQSAYHLSYSYLVNTPYLLPASLRIPHLVVIYSHYITTPTKVPLVTIFPSQVQSVHHLSYPYQVRISPIITNNKGRYL